MSKRSKRRIRTPWTYKGFSIYPADMNSSGIRWDAFGGLKSDTKQGMRELITDEISKHIVEKL